MFHSTKGKFNKKNKNKHRCTDNGTFPRLNLNSKFLMYVSYKQDQNLHPNIVEEHDNEQTNNEERPITQSNHEEKYETDEERNENVNKTVTENESEQVFKTSSKDPFEMYN